MKRVTPPNLERKQCYHVSETKDHTAALCKATHPRVSYTGGPPLPQPAGYLSRRLLLYPLGIAP